MEELSKMNCEKSICPVKKTADIVWKKWTTLIIRELLDEKKSFSEIQKSLSDISSKVLTDRLKFLEQQNIISRKAYPTVPVTTEYKLTKLWLDFRGLIESMAEFWNKL